MPLIIDYLRHAAMPRLIRRHVDTFLLLHIAATAMMRLIRC